MLKKILKLGTPLCLLIILFTSLVLVKYSYAESRENLTINENKGNSLYDAAFGEGSSAGFIPEKPHPQIQQGEPEKIEKEEVLNTEVYRNEEYHFRIKFPKGWDIKDGDGKHVVKKAVKDGSTVMVLVFDNYFKNILTEEDRRSLSEKDLASLDSMSLDEFNEQDLNNFLEQVVKMNLEAVPNSKILEKGIKYIDNHKAIYYKNSVTYKTLDIEITAESLNYWLFHNGKMYQIIGSYGIHPSDETANKSILESSIASFVFEDWDSSSAKIKSDAVTSNTANSDTIPAMVIFSFLFTWGIGLIIPVVLRFIIFKKPLHQGVAFLVASIVGIAQLAMSVLSGNKSSHFALILIASISYLIMRDGAKKRKKRYCKICGKKIKSYSNVCKNCRKNNY